MILFVYCGLADSLVQTYAYWILGALTSCPSTLSRYVGYYKGVQSLGAMAAWLIEFYGVLYRWQLVICSVLAAAFIPPTLVVAAMVTDHGGAEGEVDAEGGEGPAVAEQEELAGVVLEEQDLRQNLLA